MTKLYSILASVAAGGISLALFAGIVTAFEEDSLGAPDAAAAVVQVAPQRG